MLELVKELGFIPESRAIRIWKNDSNVLWGDRYDKVSYLRERLPDSIECDISSDGVYVEACRFLPLVPYIRTIRAMDDYLDIRLKNNATYKLPYLDIEFRMAPFEVGDALITGNIDLSTLKKTVLPNLVKPEMRCIYVDSKGAVSCNFLQGTVDKKIRSSVPVLLPPDLINYITAVTVGTIYDCGDRLLYLSTNRDLQIVCPKADFEEEDEHWYDVIYQKAVSVDSSHYGDIPIGMEEALKRLALFGSEVEVHSDRLVSGENVEPMSLQGAHGGKFSLEEISSVIDLGKQIAFSENALFLKNSDVTIMVSEQEEE